MANRALWLVVAAVGVAVLAAILVWRTGRDGRDADADPQEFRAGSVAVVSPELAVSEALVRGTIFPEYTDWSCVFDCREPEGCHAEVLLTITYRSGGDRLEVKLGRRLDTAMGETARLGRAQRPPTAVDEVEGVTLDVLATQSPGAARPTPMI